MVVAQVECSNTELGFFFGSIANVKRRPWVIWFARLRTLNILCTSFLPRAEASAFVKTVLEVSSDGIANTQGGFCDSLVLSLQMLHILRTVSVHVHLSECVKTATEVLSVGIAHKKSRFSVS